MNLKPYEKINIAEQMLETALSLFFEGKDYFSVLQIAGACEEILGQHVKLKGISNCLENDAEAYREVKRFLYDEKIALKGAINFLNKPKNSIKHMDGSNDTTTTMDPRESARAILERALTNWWKLERCFTPTMEKFLNFPKK
jgi:hypothetical protein